MSVTSIHQCRNLKSMIRYCTTPKAGQVTERIAMMFCDLGNADLFLEYGEETIKSHHRKVQGYTLLQSFSPNEFDVNNQEHIAIVNELGRKLAYALYPNSPCLVITHADSNGQCLHNHILVLNHDLSSDGCIKSNRHYKYVREANDRLMQKHGLEICKPSDQKMTQGEYWSNKRNNWLDQLKECVDKALSQSCSMQEFYNNLLSEGVTPSIYKANGALKERFTYTVTDNDGKVHKKRSDRLGSEYTRKAIEETLLSHKRSRGQQAIMPMSDWIAIQQAKERDENMQQQAESTPTSPVDILDIQNLQSKKESPRIPEREKNMKEDSKKEMLHEVQKDKEYQLLLKRRINIQNQIDLLNRKFDDDSYSEADFAELNRLQKELRQIDIALNQLIKSTNTDVELDTSLLPKDQPCLSKDVGLSL